MASCYCSAWSCERPRLGKAQQLWARARAHRRVLLQDNALGSLVNKQGSGEDGKLDREALLGFQQGRN